MILQVRLFAVLRELAGESELGVDVAEDATAADVLARLREEPALGDALDRMPVMVAVNRRMAEATTRLAPGDEVALIPPVSGGAPGPHARVSDEPLSLDELRRRVADPGAGAIVVFEGVTREVERLEYEAYTEMAEAQMAEILAACMERHGLRGIAAEHRVGTVPLGEPAVIVAVAAAHREEAFAAAREAIDEIKATAAIWKREVDGEVQRWV